MFAVTFLLVRVFTRIFSHRVLVYLCVCVCVCVCVCGFRCVVAGECGKCCEILLILV